MKRRARNENGCQKLQFQIAVLRPALPVDPFTAIISGPSTPTTTNELTPHINMDTTNEPTSSRLSGKTVAILATDGFELSELRSPKEALLAAGATIKLVSLKNGTIKGWSGGNWEGTETVDLIVDDANAEDYDALLLPGGVINPDKLRMNPTAVAFARAFMDAKKPVAAICHGPWLLAEADVVRGCRMTSYGSIKTDLRNAGAEWVDEEVVVDHGLVTSRSPKDLPAFNRKLVEEVREGVHQCA